MADGLDHVDLVGALEPVGRAVEEAVVSQAGGAFGPLEEDPDFIEVARILGRRCGPDQALGIAMMAAKG